MFFLAFLPQFVSQQSGYVPLQMVGLGLIFAIFGVTFLTVLALFAGSIGDWLTRRQTLAGMIRWLTGAILIGLGLRLAFVQRR